MPSITPVSFGATPTRQTYYQKYTNLPYGGQSVETTRDEFIKSYDKQIEKIQDYKNYAMQLDDMMFNDPDIQESLEELPDEMKIEVVGNFQTQVSENNNELNIDPPILSASRKVIEKAPKAKKMTRMEKNNASILVLGYDKKGPDKKLILKWLDNLKTIFE